MSHVTCHVSRVMYHMSHVACHMSYVFFLFVGLSGGGSRWRVCYQRGLPRVVYNYGWPKQLCQPQHILDKILESCQSASHGALSPAAEVDLLRAFLPWSLPERQAMVMWPPCFQVTNHLKTDKNKGLKLKQIIRISHDFLMTFSWLSYDFPMTFLWLSLKFFLITFFGLSHDFLMTFSWLSMDFLKTFE